MRELWCFWPEIQNSGEGKNQERKKGSKVVERREKRGKRERECACVSLLRMGWFALLHVELMIMWKSTP